MNSLNCRESFLDNVVAIHIYSAADLSVPIPPAVPIQSLDLSLPAAQPVFKAHMAETDGFTVMSDFPTLKIANARSAAGNVYTHDLQIPTDLDRPAADNAVRSLQGGDFYVVYQKTDGSLSLSYPLPNTAVADIEENISSSLSVSIKIKMQSMSPLIDII